MDTRASYIDNPAAHAAYHEAGHAIVGWALGRHVDSVTIDPSGHGSTILAGHPGDSTSRAAVGMAGHLSERRFTGSTLEASDGDAEALHDLLIAEPYNVAEAAARAEDIIDTYGDEIRRLAAALLRQRTLTGAQVEQLITSQEEPTMRDLASATVDELCAEIERYTGVTAADVRFQLQVAETRKQANVDEQVARIERCLAQIRQARRRVEHLWGCYRDGLASFDEVRDAVAEAERHETWLRQATYAETAEQLLNAPNMPRKFDLARRMVESATRKRPT